MYISIINLNTYSLKHFNLFVNHVCPSNFLSSLGINLDFFFIQHSAISQFILTILVFVIMVWALMRSFKISCWLHENFQWVTRTIHTLHLLVKDIISASSHRHKQGLARAKVACRKQHQSVHWSEETEYIIPAHSENRWDKDTFYPSKTDTATQFFHDYVQNLTSCPSLLLNCRCNISRRPSTFLYVLIVARS